LKTCPRIERWRDGLDEAQRRRLNHTNAIWFAWHSHVCFARDKWIKKYFQSILKKKKSPKTVRTKKNREIDQSQNHYRKKYRERHSKF